MIDDGLLRTYNCLQNGHRLSIKIDPCRGKALYQLTERRVHPAAGSAEGDQSRSQDIDRPDRLTIQFNPLRSRYSALEFVTVVRSRTTFLTLRSYIEFLLSFKLHGTF